MEHQIRTSLLMLSYLNERDQVSPVRIFSSLVVFPLVLDLSETSFLCVVWESNQIYGIIGYVLKYPQPQTSKVLKYLGPPLTATCPTCSSGASTFWKELPHQVFLKVPNILFLVQQSVVISVCTTLSPANSVAATVKIPGMDLTPYCTAWDGNLCPFVLLLPLKFQKLLAPSPLR